MRALAVAVLCVASCYSQAEAPDLTGGAYNGRYWTRCPEAVKAGIVVGFGSAMQVPSGLPSQLREMFAFRGTVGDLVRAIDGYYRRHEDLRMPIWAVMRIVKLEADGLSESEIGERMVADGMWRATK